MRTLLSVAIVSLFFTNSLSAHTPAERQKDLSNEIAKHIDPVWVTNIFNHQDMCEGREVAQPVLRTWGELSANVMSDVSLARGEMFFRYNESTIRNSAKHFSDDPLLPFVMMGILRIESDFGENRAGTPVIRTLFERYQKVVDGKSGDARRAKIFNEEILPFMRMAHASGWDVCSVLGTRAAAFGYPHFIPASLRLSVDGDGDGKVDLMWNLSDATASIGNYLSVTGWAKNPRRAVFRYNPDPKYVAIVFAYAERLKKKLE
ncbi:MAG: lytic murein transglycosylase [Candidatus Pacebacteria bacterium]|nr:lytic murein transglycosylase [Candidatus Paceibacterota bacterium]